MEQTYDHCDACLARADFLVTAVWDVDSHSRVCWSHLVGAVDEYTEDGGACRVARR
jgi:hypothetical protein